MASPTAPALLKPRTTWKVCLSPKGTFHRRNVLNLKELAFHSGIHVASCVESEHIMQIWQHLPSVGRIWHAPKRMLTSGAARALAYLLLESVARLEREGKSDYARDRGLMAVCL